MPADPHRWPTRSPGCLAVLVLAATGGMAVLGSPDEVPATFLVQPYLQLPTPTGMTIMWETSRELPGRVEYGATADLGRTAVERGASSLHHVRLNGLRAGATYYYRVRSGGLVSDIYPFRTAPPPGTRRWRMAVYGDSRSNPAAHRRVAEAIARARPDLIVHTGDIVLNGKNHDSWRREFFEPLGDLARSVPWVSTIGNHERDAENYFDYTALPGNDHYFSLEYANADVICLDSNSWIEKGRDSEQFRWLADHLRRPRAATWTFAVFHHPLFSAHATRPINPLRWDWAPVFLDPANRVDGVLTGHDHFYARNYRMGGVGEKPQAGVLFLTTAGGGASLYRLKQRDYVARAQSVYHFTLFDFDGDRATIVATDVTGREIDRTVLTKEPTPADEFCSYEVEELRQHLRLALAGAEVVHLRHDRAATIDTALRVPTRFAVPVSGRLEWQAAPGWTPKQTTVPFRLEPGQPLVLPLQAEVAAGSFPRNPTVVIRFDPGRFRNRTVSLSPFALAGPGRVVADQTCTPPALDGKRDDRIWHPAADHALLGLPPRGGRRDSVRFVTDRDFFYVGARLDDPDGHARVRTGPAEEEGSRLTLLDDHFRVMLSDGKKTVTFAITPEQVRYSNADVDWRGIAAAVDGGWGAEVAVPRRLFTDWSQVLVNLAHRRVEGRETAEFQLCPSFKMGSDPDDLSSIVPADLPERFARLVLP